MYGGSLSFAGNITTAGNLLYWIGMWPGTTYLLQAPPPKHTCHYNWTVLNLNRHQQQAQSREMNAAVLPYLSTSNLVTSTVLLWPRSMKRSADRLTYL
eukprot:COSAG02_NODE_471_length_21662_cov_70.510040_25_plen_98_part_00